MKICFKCGKNKSLKEFYRHKGMADGHLNKCKICARLDTKERSERPDMIDKIREEKRIWARTKGRESRDAYQKGYGKNLCNAAKNKYTKENPKKRRVHNAVNNAVRDGILKKPTSCECCKKYSNRINAHHCDYNKPLDVMWLCQSCHSEWHRKNNALNG